MNPGRRHRQGTRWIAILAVWWVALLPALSQALASPGGQGQEVCTAQGPRWLPADAGDERPPALAHTPDHCKACSWHTPCGGLPPSAAAPLPLPALAHAAPRAVVAVPRTPRAWVSACPRAPPTLS